MLDQQDGVREIPRQLGQHVLQRHWPAGGGADGHQLIALAAALEARGGARRAYRLGRSLAGASRGATQDGPYHGLRHPGLGRHQEALAGDLPDPLLQQPDRFVLVAGDVFELLGEKVEGTGVQRIQGRLGAIVGQRGEHQYGGGTLGHDLAHGADAVEYRHLYVHGDDVGPQLQRLVHRLPSILGRVDHRHQGILIDDFADPAAEEARIVDH
ncbi:hypothetical protein D3C79_706970 [compost metagenome]